MQQQKRDVLVPLWQSLRHDWDVAVGVEGLLLRKMGVAAPQKGLPRGDEDVLAALRLSL
jgi:hypothetical protein